MKKWLFLFALLGIAQAQTSTLTVTTVGSGSVTSSPSGNYLSQAPARLVLLLDQM